VTEKFDEKFDEEFAEKFAVQFKKKSLGRVAESRATWL
jgi:hypothetical protein